MKHFSLSEFDCKCCGVNNTSNDFLAMIDLARDISKVAYVILSGCRCEKNNKAAGSSSRNHIEGKAADIKATTNRQRGKILKGLYLAGFKRIGVNVAEGYIHTDSMDSVESFWLD